MTDLLSIDPNLTSDDPASLRKALTKATSLGTLTPSLTLCHQPSAFSCVTMPHEGVPLHAFLRAEKISTLLPAHLEEMCKLACKVWLLGKREKQSQIIFIHSSKDTNPETSIYVLIEQFIYLSSLSPIHDSQLHGDLLKSIYLLNLMCASPINDKYWVDLVHFQTHLQYDASGVIRGMQVTLFQNLVQFPVNLMIFHVLCQSPVAWMKKYLMDPSKFQLLSSVSVPLTTDHFRIFWKCLKTLSLPADVLVKWIKTLLAILHLGNITFTSSTRKKEESANVVDNTPLLQVASCLDVSTDTVLQWITTQTMKTSSGDTYTAFLSAEAAVESKLKCMQVLYENCVRWVVEGINARHHGQGDFDIHLIGLPTATQNPIHMYMSQMWQDQVWYRTQKASLKVYEQLRKNFPKLPSFPSTLKAPSPYLFSPSQDLDEDVFKTKYANICTGPNEFLVDHVLNGPMHYPISLFLQPCTSLVPTFLQTIFSLSSLPPDFQRTEEAWIALQKQLDRCRLWTCFLFPSCSDDFFKRLDLSLFVFLARQQSFYMNLGKTEEEWLKMEWTSTTPIESMVNDPLYRTFFLLHHKKSTNVASNSPKSYVSSLLDLEVGEVDNPAQKNTPIAMTAPTMAMATTTKTSTTRASSSKPLPIQSKLSKTRRRWMCATSCVTGWIPSWCLKTCGRMRSPDVQQAWREKVTLCAFIFFLSAVMVFFIAGLGRVICPKSDLLSFQDLAKDSVTTRFVLHGFVYDTSGWSHPEGTNFFPSDYSDLKNSDISPLFPRGNLLTRMYPSVCGNAIMPMSCTTDILTKKNNPGYCHNYTSFVQKMYYEILPFKKVGTLAWSRDVVQSKTTPDQMFVMMDKQIYDITYLVWIGSPLPSLQVDILKAHAGRDVSSYRDSLNVACLNAVAYVGRLDDRDTLACSVGTYILYVATYTMVAVMVVKFLSALQFGTKRLPESIDRYVILQVPCYSEGLDSLVKTIDSLALTSYKDTHKLLFIVADGMVKGAGNEKPTPELVLDLLGVQDRDAKAYSYLAIGEGSKQHNKGKVYSGLYHVHDRAVPYVVVIKCGTDKETTKAGNRGKRDSQMILMRFLNKVLLDLPMHPLELELHRHFSQVIGVSPIMYEYVLMVDADTEVGADCLTRLVATCLNDTKVMGLCGETRIANEHTSWVTMIQVYEYFISHHLAKAFESLFGSVTCLPGCFCMYRVYMNQEGGKRVPLIISDRILQEYSEYKVDTLHKKNLLSLGEDRYLTTLLLKTFPQYRTKFTSDSFCYTIVPDSFAVLLSQRRRWINSTIHNLFELLAVSDLCGCLIFSMRFVVFLDLFATLIMPASVAYLGYLIYLVSSDSSTYLQVLILIGATYGMQVIIFLLKRQWQHIGWMIIHLLAMPVFYFYIPLYAFWHFDDFSWGTTRKIEGDLSKGRGGGHDNDGDTFDPNMIPVLTWEGYKKSMISKTPDATHVNSMKAVQYLPFPSDQDIERETLKLLKQADLSTLTKRNIRDTLSHYFGVDLSSKRELIHHLVTEYLQSYASQSSLPSTPPG
ncbi:hypothetical protein HMI54_015556 [Coelomomyces lativittatus]|nr:hypothetical protein HMI56_006408 [Coelomomyces lativittatus]KAJ1510520.1 hypothetical protein HMI55_006963 [Coelomomyces lativittatus]KAJ1512699.1 hypothetical protein HMI54_015556 [Coelomomyces lativittatus]